jgi:hypothetical protein
VGEGDSVEGALDELEEEACRRSRTCGLRICGLHSDKHDVQFRQLDEGDESTVSSGEE